MAKPQVPNWLNLLLAFDELSSRSLPTPYDDPAKIDRIRAVLDAVAAAPPRHGVLANVLQLDDDGTIYVGWQDQKRRFSMTFSADGRVQLRLVDRESYECVMLSHESREWLHGRGPGLARE